METHHFVIGDTSSFMVCFWPLTCCFPAWFHLEVVVSQLHRRRERLGTLGLESLGVKPQHHDLAQFVWVILVYQVYPLLKGSLGGVKQLGALHPKGTTIFPMIWSF